MNTLYIVATPIGNLKDITLRALEVLREADLIVCEDTRVTSKLLNHYGISKPLTSYFQHSKFSKLEYIIEQLRQGKKIALVTDAGTPGISDPGNLLIKHITCNTKQDEVAIIPIPGPSAVIAALSISGFPTDKFVFMGFSPQKKGREKFFKEIVEAKYTTVFYESVHRIIKTLERLKEFLPADRKIVVCRELTKQFETIYRGTASEVLEAVKNDKIKGEFVIVIR
ncbi:16S rRNA (cytidine(1402)-2'-O)-methyltransferase [Candidatus Falkowbacteria bacterium]|nr:16S rRNA (cytidine(1402)-2'-O)-methyltransferase [Candidatus Falkowbacteria bacterium]